MRVENYTTLAQIYLLISFYIFGEYHQPTHTSTTAQCWICSPRNSFVCCCLTTFHILCAGKCYIFLLSRVLFPQQCCAIFTPKNCAVVVTLLEYIGSISPVSVTFWKELKVIHSQSRMILCSACIHIMYAPSMQLARPQSELDQTKNDILMCGTNTDQIFYLSFVLEDEMFLLLLPISGTIFFPQMSKPRIGAYLFPCTPLL